MTGIMNHAHMSLLFSSCACLAARMPLRIITASTTAPSTCVNLIFGILDGICSAFFSMRPHLEKTRLASLSLQVLLWPKRKLYESMRWSLTWPCMFSARRSIVRSISNQALMVIGPLNMPSVTLNNLQESQCMCNKIQKACQTKRDWEFMDFWCCGRCWEHLFFGQLLTNWWTLYHDMCII